MLSQSEILSHLAARRPAFALERDLYCDPGVFAADLETIWYREWLFAAPAAAFRKAGDYVTLQVGAYPVILVRGGDGRVRAFHNVCRHRGQRLCASAQGQTARLVCPYHQWTYDLDGRLLWARDMGEGFDAAAYGLKRIHCLDLGGVVYICLAEVPPPVADLARTAAQYLAPHGLDRARIAHASTITEAGNWKLVMENNRECYHCGGSHPALCRTYSDNPRHTAIYGPEAASAEILAHWARCEAAGLPSRFVHGPDYQWRFARIPLLDNAESFTLSTRAAVSRRMGTMPFNDAGSLLFYHYPNSWNHFLADHAIVFRVLPVSPTETEVTTFWLVHDEAEEGRDYEQGTLTEVWLATNDEDRRVVEENQRGIASPAYEPGPYSPVQEEGVIQFVDWYCALMQRRLAPKPALAAE
ncbi:MAG: aromatic ring-hydroxylating oxygenase subunit alpha [Gemmobacter sp.]